MTFKFLHSMYDKTIIRFGFWDIRNNQGRGEGYEPQPWASADNPYLNRDYSRYHKNLIPIIVYNCTRTHLKHHALHEKELLDPAGMAQ